LKVAESANVLRRKKEAESDTRSDEININSPSKKGPRQQTRASFGDAFQPNKEPDIENELAERSIRPKTREQPYRYEDPEDASQTPTSRSPK
jgi:hypothetical protein